MARTRKGGAPGKGNPGGRRGGNRGDEGSKYASKPQAQKPRRSSQAAGKDPARGRGR